METMFLYSNMLFCTSFFIPLTQGIYKAKRRHTKVSRPVFSKKEILLDTQLFANILWNRVLVNNDVHSLVACKCL